MIVINPTQFRTHQKKYLDLAEKERVFIKRGHKIIELVVSGDSPESTSPSGDDWFDDPDNLRSVEKGIEDVKGGKTVKLTTELQQELFGDL